MLSEAVAIYFADVRLASAFVARWCAGNRVETTGSVARMSRRRGSGRRSIGYRERAEPDMQSSTLA